MTRVLLTRAQLRELRRHLLREDAKEYMAYAFGRRTGEEEPEDLVIEELLLAEGDDYVSHGPAHLRLDPMFQLAAKNRCRALSPDLVLQIHSHPFARVGHFSSIDDRDFPEIAYDFVNVSEDVRCGRWVWGQRIKGSALEISPRGERSVEGLTPAELTIVGTTPPLEARS